MAQVATINKRNGKTHASSVDWDAANRNVYSQFGEDGVIEKWLEVYGSGSEWCFEVGAHNGKQFSNTLRLREEGWSALLVEADAIYREDLLSHEASNVVSLCPMTVEREGTDTLDNMLREVNAPRAIDVGVIDIDAYDYWIWDSLTVFRPRLMCIEIHHKDDKHEPPPLYTEIDNETLSSSQTGIKYMNGLARLKGYELVTRTRCNAFYMATN